MENSLKDVNEQSRQMGGRRAVLPASLTWGGAGRPAQSKAKGVGSEGGIRSQRAWRPGVWTWIPREMGRLL